MTEDLTVKNFTNIDDEDFEGMWGGEKYPVKAGETKQFPGFLVDHFAGQLAKKILLRQGADNFMDPLKTKPLIKQMKGEIEVEVLEEEPEAKPKAKAKSKAAPKKEKAFPKKPKAKKRGKK
jgi:hypothetical protein